MEKNSSRDSPRPAETTALLIRREGSLPQNFGSHRLSLPPQHILGAEVQENGEKKKERKPGNFPPSLGVGDWWLLWPPETFSRSSLCPVWCLFRGDGLLCTQAGGILAEKNSKLTDGLLYFKLRSFPQFLCQYLCPRP